MARVVPPHRRVVDAWLVEWARRVDDANEWVIVRHVGQVLARASGVVVPGARREEVGMKDCACWCARASSSLVVEWQQRSEAAEGKQLVQKRAGRFFLATRGAGGSHERGESAPKNLPGPP